MASRSVHRLLVLSVAVLLTLGLACGGSSADDSTPISENEAKAAANSYLKSTLGFFTGDTSARNYIEVFAPECREGVDPQALEFILLFLQAFAPELRDLKVEDVDIGAITLQQTADGTLVVPNDPDSVRVKVNGQFKPASEVFAEVGFDGMSDEEVEPILLVRRGGKIYVGDCADLQDFAE